MSDFRNLKLFGMDSLRETHPAFAGLQAKYNSPGKFCKPEELFREEQLDYSILYYKRCCSVYDFYNMLSIDDPCYVKRIVRRVGNANGRSFSRDLMSREDKTARSECKCSPGRPFGCLLCA
jgi:hypothetical protein